MQMYEIRRNMILQCSFHGGAPEPVRVDNPKIKKITVMRQDGQTWDVYPHHLSPTDLPFNLEVEEATDLVLGAAVMFTDGPRQGTVYVITGTNRGAGFSAAKLFGDANRYVHHIQPASIREASHEDVAEYLLARANRA